MTKLPMEEETGKLKAENEQLRAELAIANSKLRRCKDPDPVQRPSWKRVIRLVHDACLDLQRVKGGWLLKFGRLVRRFRFLKEIWEILTAESWLISELFPPVKETALTLPPRLPFRHPVLAAKQPQPQNST